MQNGLRFATDDPGPVGKPLSARSAWGAMARASCRTPGGRRWRRWRPRGRWIRPLSRSRGALLTAGPVQSRSALRWRSDRRLGLAAVVSVTVPLTGTLDTSSSPLRVRVVTVLRMDDPAVQAMIGGELDRVVGGDGVAGGVNRGGRELQRRPRDRTLGGRREGRLSGDPAGIDGDGCAARRPAAHPKLRPASRHRGVCQRARLRAAHGHRIRRLPAPPGAPATSADRTVHTALGLLAGPDPPYRRVRAGCVLEPPRAPDRGSQPPER